MLVFSLRPFLQYLGYTRMRDWRSKPMPASVLQALMQSLSIVKLKVPPKPLLGIPRLLIIFQIHFLKFQTTP